MKTVASSSLAFAATGLLALTGNAEPIRRQLPLVDDQAFQDSITLENLIGCAQDLEDIAYATPYRNRVHGTPGHLNSVQYFIDQLGSLGDYYDVSTQDFTTEVTVFSTASLTIDGETLDNDKFEFGNNGTWTDVPLANVANFGCNAEDFTDLTGTVALIARGNCTFVEKLTFAGAVGAVGAVIYNNAEVGPAAGTLGGVNDLIAVGGITRADGLRLAELVASGEEVLSSGEFSSYIATLTSYNVIANSKFGDSENVLFLGAHSDSVDAGPGINDNGSGSCGLLTVAKALAQYQTNNQVRFAWWTAEEEGLLGAEHYTNITDASELDKIRLYLNFDMIASPNYVLGIYDGDGGAFNLSGPAGSAEAEELFEDWFDAQGLPHTAAEFSGRSDYGPFLDKGVPCSGLDTGADGVKTEEEVTLFGGVANETYDQNYHSAGDNVTNLAPVPFELNGKAIAHAIATYGTSWEGFPLRQTTSPVVRRKLLGPTPSRFMRRKSKHAKKAY